MITENTVFHRTIAHTYFTSVVPVALGDHVLMVEKLGDPPAVGAGDGDPVKLFARDPMQGGGQGIWGPAGRRCEDGFTDSFVADAAAADEQRGTGGTHPGGEGRELVLSGEACGGSGDTFEQDFGAVAALAPGEAAGNGAGNGFLSPDSWEVRRDSRPMGPAVLPPWAEQAGGLAWSANEGAQLHDGLVEVAWPPCVEKLPGMGAAGLERGGGIGVFDGIAAQSGQDADDIAVGNGRGLSESDAGNGGGGVGAHPGEAYPVLCGLREGIHGGHLAGQLVEVAGPGVVAKAFPMLEDCFFRGRAKCWEVGKGLNPFFKVGKHGGHLRLLQHEFGDNGMVGRGVTAPRQVPPVLLIPIKQTAAEGGNGQRRGIGGQQNGFWVRVAGCVGSR